MRCLPHYSYIYYCCQKSAYRLTANYTATNCFRSRNGHFRRARTDEPETPAGLAQRRWDPFPGQYSRDAESIKSGSDCARHEEGTHGCSTNSTYRQCNLQKQPSKPYQKKPQKSNVSVNNVLQRTPQPHLLLLQTHPPRLLLF